MQALFQKMDRLSRHIDSFALAWRWCLQTQAAMTPTKIEETGHAAAWEDAACQRWIVPCQSAGQAGDARQGGISAMQRR